MQKQTSKLTPADKNFVKAIKVLSDHQLNVLLYFLFFPDARGEASFEEWFSRSNFVPPNYHSSFDALIHGANHRGLSLNIFCSGKNKYTFEALCGSIIADREGESARAGAELAVQVLLDADEKECAG